MNEGGNIANDTARGCFKSDVSGTSGIVSISEIKQWRATGGIQIMCERWHELHTVGLPNELQRQNKRSRRVIGLGAIEKGTRNDLGKLITNV